MPRAPKNVSTTFACTICDATFTRKPELARHGKLHARDVDALKTPCPYRDCTYRTLQKNNLKTHVTAVHLKMKPYKCNAMNCSWAFADAASLIRHEKGQHGISRGGKSKSRCIPRDPMAPKKSDTAIPSTTFTLPPSADASMSTFFIPSYPEVDSNAASPASTSSYSTCHTPIDACSPPYTPLFDTDLFKQEYSQTICDMSQSSDGGLAYYDHLDSHPYTSFAPVSPVDMFTDLPQPAPAPQSAYSTAPLGCTSTPPPGQEYYPPFAFSSAKQPSHHVFSYNPTRAEWTMVQQILSDEPVPMQEFPQVDIAKVDLDSNVDLREVLSF